MLNQALCLKKCFKKLDPDTHTTPVPSKTVFHGIGGDQKSYGIADFTYHVGQKQLITSMNITDLKGLDAILGMDMLECMGATIDVVKGTLTFHDGEMIQLIRHIDHSAHLCCEDQVRLKAMQARVVTTKTDGWHDTA